MDGSIIDMKMKKKITLISSNDMVFDDIDLTMLYGCPVIKRRIEKVEEEGGSGSGCCGGDDDNKIILRVPELTGKILSLVLEFCTKHGVHGEEDLKRWQTKLATDEDLKKWVVKLATEIDGPTLAHLILATRFLNMWELFEVAVNVMNAKGKSPLEYADIFEGRLENEEEEVSRDNLWGK